MDNWNKRPFDNWVPSPSRFTKGDKAEKDEHIHTVNIDRKMKATKARRAKVELKALVNGKAVDVAKDAPVQSFGQYKYEGTWYAITIGTRGEWVKDCEVRNVPSKSLPAVLAAGGIASDTERKRIAAGAAAEDQNAPVLVLAQRVEQDQAEDDVNEEASPATKAYKRSRASPARRKKASQMAEYSPRQRRSRNTRSVDEGMQDDDSEIEVSQPARKQDQSERRRNQPLAFPNGLQGTPTAPPPVTSLGQYLYKSTWYSIGVNDPDDWVNGRPVRNVPAEHRAEIARRNGIFDD